MVCKEEVFMWFKELSGSKRISVMCGLLNMCYPLELRFLGTCLEDLGKKDFYCFQEAEAKANHVNEIRKLSDLKDNVTRCKLIVSLALLHSSNHVCSNVLFQTLTKHNQSCSDQRTLNEMLLLLTMALNHPAFTFDQKTILTQQFLAVEKLINDSNQTNHEGHTWQRCASAVIPDSMQAAVSVCPTISTAISTAVVTPATVTSVAPVISTANVTTTSSTCPHHHQIISTRANEAVNQVRISSLKSKAFYKRRSYRIRAAWTNGRYTDVSKTCHEIVVFHQKLLQLFPQDVHNNNQDKYILTLPGIIASQGEEINDESVSAFNDYLRQLTNHLPHHILDCEYVTAFFKPPAYARGGTRGKMFPNDTFPEDGARVPSITIYNSQRADGSSRSKTGSIHNNNNSSHNSHFSPDSSSGQSQTSTTSPVRSSTSSPVSSPYVSPPQSGSNSRSASPWIQRPVRTTGDEREGTFLEQLLRREHLSECLEKLKAYKLEELQCMGQEKLEHIGISKISAGKLRKILDNLRNCTSMNGINTHLSGNQSISTPASVLSSQGSTNQISSESSPSCSEYSSPPPSPPLSESSRQQNTEKTDSEECLHEKGGNATKSEGDATMPNNEDKQYWSNKHINTKVEENQSTKDNKLVLGITPPPISYSPAILHVHSNVQKPNHLPVHGKNNSGPAPLGTSTVIFENGQYTNFALPSALSFLSHTHNNVQRSHTGTPERVLPASTVVTVTTVCPFPVVSSGCTTPTSCMATYRNSCTGTITTASLANNRHHCSKNLSTMQPMAIDGDSNQKLHQQPEVIPTHYTITPYLLPPPSPVAGHHSQPVTCTCSCTVTSSAGVPSSVPSSTQTPGTAQQPPPHPVSIPFSHCVGFLPNLFPQFPFLPAHNNSPANGLISPTMTPPPPTVHNFPFPLANGLPPELLYGRQSFSIPPPSPNPNSVQSNPAQSPTPVSSPVNAVYNGSNTCFSKYSQSASNGASGKVSCFNCGKVGHRGTDCKDSPLDDGRHYANNVCKSGNS